MKWLALVLVMVFSFASFATERPYAGPTEALLKRIDNETAHYGRFEINATGSLTTYASGTLVLGDFIPADSFIYDVKAYIDTVFTSNSGTTLSLGCQTAVDLIASVNLTNATYVDGYVLQGIPNNASTNIIRTTADCTPTFGITSTNNSDAQIYSGKLIVLIKYLPVNDLR